MGTPSSSFWTPSADIQAAKTGHVTTDVYIPTGKPVGIRPGTVTNLGLTAGFSLTDKVSAELGFDHIEGTYPIYLNGKIGIPENAYGRSPALAFGIQSVGLKRNGEARAGRTAKTGTDYDIFYVRAAKTVDRVGRLTAGYYVGNKQLLVDHLGREENDGLMLTWEKTLDSISENLAVNVDYMGGKSNYGVLVYGFIWKFAPNVGVAVGFVDQDNKRLNPGNTFVVEVDIDFDFPKMNR